MIPRRTHHRQVSERHAKKLRTALVRVGSKAALMRATGLDLLTLNDALDLGDFSEDKAARLERMIDTLESA